MIMRSCIYYISKLSANNLLDYWSPSESVDSRYHSTYMLIP